MPTRTRKPAPSISRAVTKFRQWLDIKDVAAVEKARQEELRKELLAFVEGNGYEDEKGNFWFDLPEPIRFEATDPKDQTKGKVFVYSGLKRQRSLTPAQPVPDPEKAEKLLRRKKKWLTREQEETIRDLQLQCPFVTISVDVDVDSVTQLYFKKVISEDEYDDILQEQTENFSFIPVES